MTTVGETPTRVRVVRLVDYSLIVHAVSDAGPGRDDGAGRVTRCGKSADGYLEVELPVAEVTCQVCRRKLGCVPSSPASPTGGASPDRRSDG